MEWVKCKRAQEFKGFEISKFTRSYVRSRIDFTALAELSTRQAAESTQATGLEENKNAAQIGGNIAKHAREEYEERTGGKVVSDSNFLPKKSKTQQIKNKKK